MGQDTENKNDIANITFYPKAIKRRSLEEWVKTRCNDGDQIDFHKVGAESYVLQNVRSKEVFLIVDLDRVKETQTKEG